MRPALRLLPIAAACAALASCQNGQNTGLGGGNSPYVSNFGNDGGYNPYPDQPGTMQSGTYTPPPTSSAPPTYVTPPTPPSDPYAFHSPSSSSSASSAAPSRPAAPRKSTASTSKPKPKAPAAKKSGSYKVVGGDTLYGIARKRGTTVAKIKSANGLSSDLIRPGQVLKIP